MFSTHYLTDTILCEQFHSLAMHFFGTNISNKLDGLRYKLCHYKVCVHIYIHIYTWFYPVWLYSLFFILCRFAFVSTSSKWAAKMFHFSLLIPMILCRMKQNPRIKWNIGKCHWMFWMCFIFMKSVCLFYANM